MTTEIQAPAGISREEMIEWVCRLPEPLRRRVLDDIEANGRDGAAR